MDSQLIWIAPLVVFCIGILVLKRLVTPEKMKVNKTHYYPNPNYRAEKTPERMPFPNLLDSNDDDGVYLSVIVPAYNEEERLPTMMDECIEYLHEREKKEPTFSWEIIVVDDGSRDKTCHVVQEYSKQYGADIIRLRKQSRNRGKGGAVQRGMMCARGEFLLMCDADSATHFADIESLEKALKDGAVDGRGIAVGSRAHLQEEVKADRKWYRNFLGWGFNMIIQTLFIRGVQDTQCGFKLFSRKTAQAIFPIQRTQRWTFDVELLYLATHVSPASPVFEEAVEWNEIEGSKLPFMAPIWMGLDLLRIRLIYLFGP